MGDAQSMREILGPHLPYLRRYARALSGSQKSGDAYVRAVLESLLAAPDALQDTQDPRRDLFRLFHRHWDPRHNPAGVDLAAITSPGRQLLLLTAVEGFSISDAAFIVGMDIESAQNAIADARAEIAAAMCSRVLIIEDEPVISMHLEQIVEEMGHLVAATAMTRDEAVEQAGLNRPDLVLADIQLGDGSSGLDAARDILALFDVSVIFITAYPERLLTGQRPEPTFLVTKPFEPDTVIATIGQALLSRIPALSPAA